MRIPRRTATARFILCSAAVFLLVLLATFVSSSQRKASPVERKSATPVWYRGNTHTHSNNSFDGEAPPEMVAARYKELGYNFVYLTDHNKLTSVDSLNAQLAVPGQFLVIRGEEITDYITGKPVHITSLNSSTVVAPQHGYDVLSTVQNDINAALAGGGLPYIAHPNFYFAVNSQNLKDITGTALFEVYNAHPIVNNVGDATHPSVEAMWDEVLSSGKLLYGLAADDTHTLTNPSGPLPGRAWIMVRAPSLDPEAITQAIGSGDFYSSTGVTLADYQVSATGITIELDPSSAGATIDFIGRNGQLLQRSNTNPAVYTFNGHEQYVRAKIVDNAGNAAWTQPVFTERLNPQRPIINAASLGNEITEADAIAPHSIAIALGVGLADTSVQVTRSEAGFPTTLGNTTVTVNGRAAELYYVSPGQINFHVPAETETGLAEVLINRADGVQLRSRITVNDSAPGIFTLDGSGRGKAVVFDLDKLLGTALVPEDDLRRFYIYATGASGATDVQVLVNGQPVKVECVRSCRGLPGLDQITIVFPRTLTSSGLATAVIKADGVSSNPTTLPY